MHAIEFSGFDAMSTEHHERSPHPGRRLWRRSSLVTTLMYVGLTLLMLVWGLQENLEVFTPESCELRSVNASSGWLMTHLYPRVLRHTGAGESDDGRGAADAGGGGTVDACGGRRRRRLPGAESSA
jgi:hypothetical protein